MSVSQLQDSCVPELHLNHSHYALYREKPECLCNEKAALDL